MTYPKRIAGVELRHLRYVVAIAESGSFTRAAQHLRMQQPPLSQQIRALEEKVGVRLLTRTSRGIALTDAGKVFVAGAREILASMDAVIDETRRAGAARHGAIALGYTPSTGFHPAVRAAIRSFAAACPEIAIRLVENCTAELFDDLRRGEADIGFVRAAARDPDMFETLPFLDEEMAVAMPPDHPLAETRSPIALPGLAAQSFVLYRRAAGPGLGERIVAACEAAGFRPKVAQHVPRMVTALHLVASGMGVTIVPASMRSLNEGALAFRPLDPASRLSAPIRLAYRRGPMSYEIKRFIDASGSMHGEAR